MLKLKFISPSWDQVYSQSITLATELKAVGKQKFDALIGVSRGGLALTRIMSDLLDIQNVMITRCEYYTDLGRVKTHPEITQKLQGNITGKNVLLLDDVADSGESLLEIKKYILSKKPKSLTIATLYVKPWTKFYPDFYVARTDAWIIFPWELYEAIKSIAVKHGVEKLHQTGIPQKYLKRIMNIHSDSLRGARSNSKIPAKNSHLVSKDY